jgi:hypothetical protein
MAIADTCPWVVRSSSACPGSGELLADAQTFAIAGRSARQIRHVPTRGFQACALLFDARRDCLEQFRGRLWCHIYDTWFAAHVSDHTCPAKPHWTPRRVHVLLELDLLLIRVQGGILMRRSGTEPIDCARGDCRFKRGAFQRQPMLPKSPPLVEIAGEKPGDVFDLLVGQVDSVGVDLLVVPDLCRSPILARERVRIVEAAAPQPMAKPVPSIDIGIPRQFGQEHTRQRLLVVFGLREGLLGDCCRLFRRLASYFRTTHIALRGRFGGVDCHQWAWWI